MSTSGGRRTQDTFRGKRMVWPYVLTTREDGSMEVEVRDAMCPRCRVRVRVTSSGSGVLLQCLRCSISEHRSDFGSYGALKEHVASLILDRHREEA